MLVERRPFARRASGQDYSLPVARKVKDTVRVEAEGPGRVALTRVDALLDKYRGALTPGAIANEDVERLRDEWP